VYVFFGAVGGIEAVPRITLSAPPGGPGFGANFGFSIARGRDVNGDGIADVIIGEFDSQPEGPGSGGPGHAYIYFGTACGLPSLPDVTLTGPGAGYFFAEWVG
jgi:hypothetical protein